LISLKKLPRTNVLGLCSNVRDEEIKLYNIDNRRLKEELEWVKDGHEMGAAEGDIS
jgi:hypothetical protein